MGHRVPNHKSKCRSLHGHRYKIEVAVDGYVVEERGSSDEGMVIDFGDLKEIMMDVIDKKYDHSFTMHEGDAFLDFFKTLAEREGQKINFVPFVPTAENLAEHWFQELRLPLQHKGIDIQCVQVYETPTSVAMYHEQN